MTNTPHHNRLVILLCVIAFASSIIGVVTYATHVEKVSEERAQLTRNVCTRQDEVIAVLAFLVSPERQKLVQNASGSIPSKELAASNERIRALVETINASPC